MKSDEVITLEIEGVDDRARARAALELAHRAQSAGVRCHGNACAAGQKPCPTPWACGVEPVGAAPAGPLRFCNSSQRAAYAPARVAVRAGGNDHRLIPSRGR